MANRVNVELAFTANTEQAKQQLQNLKNTLGSLSNFNGLSTSTKGMTQEIIQAANAAGQLQQKLNAATNVNTGNLNLDKLAVELKKSGTSITQYRDQLLKLGPSGAQAFQQLASSITRANTGISVSNKALVKLGTTLANTARWQLSSSLLYGFTGAIQEVITYVADLNESLNDIRIVTGYNIDQMADFAKEANKAAKALSTTTNEYAKASLIYFQQGLSDQEVKARTDVTVKMANVTSQTAEEVSDQMTAVWNNFYDGSKSLEHYADVLTALGAATASSTDEISQGLEKFSAIANTIGLSYEYAASALATVTATTRQSADLVGTAFKTLFARLESLQLGEQLDDGTSMTKYSQALATVGVSIKDASGQLRDMDSILNDLGNRWSTLTRDQQVALAQTVGGMRQYNQLIALMDNWEFFQENLSTSLGSTGTLQEQADIYAESWEAASNRVKASAEEIYDSLLNDEFFIDVMDGFSGFLGILDTVLDGLGGMPGILALVATAMINAFGPKMAAGIDHLIASTQILGQNIKASFTGGLKAGEALRSETLGARSRTDFGGVGVVENLQGDLAAQEDERNFIYHQNAGDMSDAEREIALGRLDQAKKYDEEAVLATKENEHVMESLQPKIDEQQKLVEAKRQELDIAKQTSEADQQALAAAKEELAVAEQTEAELKKKGSRGEEKATDQQLTAAAQKRAAAQKKVTQAEREVERSAKKVTKAEEDLKKAENDVTQTLKQKTDSQEKANAAVQKANAYHKTAVASVQQLGASYITAGQRIQAMASALTSLGMLVSSIQGLVSVWTDDETAPWEKLLSTLTTLGFIIPALIGTMSGLNGVMAKNIALKGADAIASKLLSDGIDGLNKEQLEAKILTELNEQGYKKETQAKMVSIITTKLQKQATNENTKATIKQTAANWGMMASMGPIMWIIMAVVAALAALAATLAIVTKAMNADAEAAKAAAEDASTLADNYNKVKEEYESLQQSLATHNEGLEALNKLTKGTDEWYDKLREVNSQVLDLMKNYPELAKYVTRNADNVLEISEEGQELLLKTQAKEVEIAYQQTLMANNRAAALQAKANQTKAIQKEFDAFTFGDEGIKGIARTATLAATMNPYVVTASIVEDIYKQASYANQTTQALEDLKAEAVKFNGALTKDQIEDVLADYEPEVVAEFTDDEGLETLNDILQEVEQINLLERQNNTELAFSALKDNKEFQNFNYQTAVASVIGDQLTDVDDSTWDEDYKGKWDKTVHEEYAEMMGWDVATIDNKSGYGVFHLEGSDETIELSDETMRYALNQADVLAEKTGKDLSLIMQGISALADIGFSLGTGMDDVLVEFAGNGAADLTKLTEEQLQVFQAKLNSGLSEITESQAIAIGAESKEALIASMRESVEEADRIWEESLKNFSFSVSAIVENDIFKNIANSARIGYGEQLQKVYNLFGAEALSGVQTFFSGLILENEEYADEIVAIMTGIDWQNMSNEEILIYVNNALDDLTINVDKNSESWKYFAEVLETEVFLALESLSSYIDKATTKLGELYGLTKDLDFGKVFSVEDYKKIIEQNSALADSFVRTLEGYTFVGDAIAGQNLAEAFAENTLERINAQISGIEKLANTKDLNISGWDNLTPDEVTGAKQEFATWSKENQEAAFAAGGLSRERYLELLGSDTEESKKTLAEFYNTIQKAVLGSDELKQSIAKSRLEFIEMGASAQETIPQLLEYAEKWGMTQEQIAPFRKLLEDSNKEAAESLQNSAFENSLKGLEATYNDLGEAANRAWGADKLNILDQQAENLEQQNVILEQQIIYLKEIQALQDQIAFDEMMAAKGSSIRYSDLQFDTATGYITNLFELAKRAEAEGTSGVLETALKESGAQDTMIKIVEIQNQIKDNVQEIQDLKLEKIEYKLEIKLEINERELDALERQFSRLEDRAFSGAEKIANLTEKFSTLEERQKAYFDTLHDVTGVTINSMEEVAAAVGNLSGKSEKEVELIKEALDGLIESVEDIIEMDKQVADLVLGAFEEVNDEFDKFTSKLERLQGILDNFKNLADVVGIGNFGITTQLLRDINAASAQLANDQLKSDVEKYRVLSERYKEAEENLKQATINNDTTGDYWRQQLEEIETLIADAGANMVESWATVVEKMKEVFESNMETMIKDFEAEMTGIYGTFERELEAFDQRKTVSERYVADYERIVELNKLNRKLQVEIDKTDNIKSQKLLRNLQVEIVALQESGAELSKYDLDYLQKKYDLRLAEIALEEAQEAKSQMRLTRNAAGNWVYQYTADESKVNEAINNYESALLSLQQFSSDYSLEMQEKIANWSQEYAQGLQELYSSGASAEVIEEYTQFMTEQLDYYNDELTKVFNNNTQLYNNEWQAYGQMVDQEIEYNLKFEKNFDETILGSIKQGETDLSTLIAKMKEYSDKLRTTINDSYRTYQTAVNDTTKLINESLGAVNPSETMGKTLKTWLGSQGDGAEEDSLYARLGEYETAFTTMVDNCNSYLGNVKDIASAWISEITPLLQTMTEAVEAANTAYIKAQELGLVTTTPPPVDEDDNNPLTEDNFASHYLVYDKTTGEVVDNGEFSDEVMYDENGEFVRAGWDASMERYNALTTVNGQKDPSLVNRYGRIIATGDTPDLASANAYKKLNDIKANLNPAEPAPVEPAPAKPAPAEPKKNGPTRLKSTAYCLDLETGIIDTVQYEEEKEKWKSSHKKYYITFDKQELLTKIHTSLKKFSLQGNYVESYLTNPELITVKDIWGEGWSDKIVACKPSFQNKGLLFDHNQESLSTDWLELSSPLTITDFVTSKQYKTSALLRSDLMEMGFSIKEIQDQFNAYKTACQYYSDLFGVIPYDTGGYTGAWGSEGKLAILHQKELILNADDTLNFLASMEIMRNLASQIDLQAAAMASSSGLPTFNFGGSPQTLQQEVHIQAEFPNATNHQEIEEAFGNLVNMATQYANRKI